MSVIVAFKNAVLRVDCFQEFRIKVFSSKNTTLSFSFVEDVSDVREREYMGFERFGTNG